MAISKHAVSPSNTPQNTVARDASSHVQQTHPLKRNTCGGSSFHVPPLDLSRAEAIQSRRLSKQKQSSNSGATGTLVNKPSLLHGGGSGDVVVHPGERRPEASTTPVPFPNAKRGWALSEGTAGAQKGSFGPAFLPRTGSLTGEIVASGDAADLPRMAPILEGRWPAGIPSSTPSQSATRSGVVKDVYAPRTAGPKSSASFVDLNIPHYPSVSKQSSISLHTKQRALGPTGISPVPAGIVPHPTAMAETVAESFPASLDKLVKLHGRAEDVPARPEDANILAVDTARTQRFADSSQCCAGSPCIGWLAAFASPARKRAAETHRTKPQQGAIMPEVERQRGKADEGFMRRLSRGLMSVVYPPDSSAGPKPLMYYRLPLKDDQMSERAVRGPSGKASAFASIAPSPSELQELLGRDGQPAHPAYCSPYFYGSSGIPTPIYSPESFPYATSAAFRTPPGSPAVAILPALAAQAFPPLGTQQSVSGGGAPSGFGEATLYIGGRGSYYPALEARPGVSYRIHSVSTVGTAAHMGLLSPDLQPQEIESQTGTTVVPTVGLVQRKTSLRGKPGSSQFAEPFSSRSLSLWKELEELKDQYRHVQDHFRRENEDLKTENVRLQATLGNIQLRVNCILDELQDIKARGSAANGGSVAEANKQLAEKCTMLLGQLLTEQRPEEKPAQPIGPLSLLSSFTEAQLQQLLAMEKRAPAETTPALPASAVPASPAPPSAAVPRKGMPAGAAASKLTSLPQTLVAGGPLPSGAADATAAKEATVGTRETTTIAAAAPPAAAALAAEARPQKQPPAAKVIPAAKTAPAAKAGLATKTALAAKTGLAAKPSTAAKAAPAAEGGPLAEAAPAAKPALEAEVGPPAEVAPAEKVAPGTKTATVAKAAPEAKAGSAAKAGPAGKAGLTPKAGPAAKAVPPAEAAAAEIPTAAPAAVATATTGKPQGEATAPVAATTPGGTAPRAATHLPAAERDTKDRESSAAQMVMSAGAAENKDLAELARRTGAAGQAGGMLHVDERGYVQVPIHMAGAAEKQKPPTATEEEKKEGEHGADVVGKTDDVRVQQQAKQAPVAVAAKEPAIPATAPAAKGKAAGMKSASPKDKARDKDTVATKEVVPATVDRGTSGRSTVVAEAAAKLETTDQEKKPEEEKQQERSSTGSFSGLFSLFFGGGSSSGEQPESEEKRGVSPTTTKRETSTEAASAPPPAATMKRKSTATDIEKVPFSSGTPVETGAAMVKPDVRRKETLPIKTAMQPIKSKQPLSADAGEKEPKAAIAAVASVPKIGMKKEPATKRTSPPHPEAGGEDGVATLAAATKEREEAIQRPFPEKEDSTVGAPPKILARTTSAGKSAERATKAGAPETGGAPHKAGMTAPQPPRTEKPAAEHGEAGPSPSPAPLKSPPTPAKPLPTPTPKTEAKAGGAKTEEKAAPVAAADAAEAKPVAAKMPGVVKAPGVAAKSVAAPAAKVEAKSPAAKAEAKTPAPSEAEEKAAPVAATDAAEAKPVAAKMPGLVKAPGVAAKSVAAPAAKVEAKSPAAKAEAKTPAPSEAEEKAAPVAAKKLPGATPERASSLDISFKTAQTGVQGREKLKTTEEASNAIDGSFPAAAADADVNRRDKDTAEHDVGNLKGEGPETPTKPATTAEQVLHKRLSIGKTQEQAPEKGVNAISTSVETGGIDSGLSSSIDAAGELTMEGLTINGKMEKHTPKSGPSIVRKGSKGVHGVNQLDPTETEQKQKKPAQGKRSATTDAKKASGPPLIRKDSATKKRVDARTGGANEAVGESEKKEAGKRQSAKGDVSRSGSLAKTGKQLTRKFSGNNIAVSKKSDAARESGAGEEKQGGADSEKKEQNMRRKEKKKENGASPKRGNSSIKAVNGADENSQNAATKKQKSIDEEGRPVRALSSGISGFLYNLFGQPTETEDADTGTK